MSTATETGFDVVVCSDDYGEVLTVLLLVPLSSPSCPSCVVEYK